MWKAWKTWSLDDGESLALGAAEKALVYSTRNAKVWPGWKYKPGDSKDVILRRQPSDDAVRAHIRQNHSNKVIEPWAINEIEFWIRHRQWCDARRR